MTAAPRTNPANSLVLNLFGPMQVQVNGKPLPRLRSRKGLWLLALLALRHGRPVERDWLVGTLWPESTQSQALYNLRQSLSDLRTALGCQADRLQAPTRHTLALDLAGADVDLLVFDAAVASGTGTELEKAIGLYGGPLLEGCQEEWAFQERQSREQAYLSALELVAEAALERGEPAKAVEYLRRALDLDPLRESALRAFLQALAARGDFAGAVLSYREFRLRLHEQLHAEPDARTQALFQQIRRQARQADTPTSMNRESQEIRTSSAVALPSKEMPEGTLTFLATDIEKSSRLWEHDPQAMQERLAQHDALLKQILEQNHEGYVFKRMGDSFLAAFASASEALQAALAIQQALQAETWQNPPLRVRIALHTGQAQQREGDYYGLPLNRVARLVSIAHGGQVLLSLATEELVREDLPAGVSLQPLGAHRLQDLTQPEQVFQLLHPDLPAVFEPLKSLDVLPTNLPTPITSFIGREKEIEEVMRLLKQTRLLTLTGSGGCGKTRLAVQVAAEVLKEFPDGVWLIELASLFDVNLVAHTVASTLGLREEPGRPFGKTLIDHLQAKKLLLLLDNCEHLLAGSASLADSLLRVCPQVSLLATSRERLGVAGEQVYRVPSLSVPDPTQLSGEEKERAAIVSEYEAVHLFVERARLQKPEFMLTRENASAVAQICHRLDGIPLAIELAAARIRMLTTAQIAARLDDRFRLLTGGSRTALPRQQTLQALIDWSYDLLSEPERRLLGRLSVFSGGWTLEAAERVCSGKSIEAWEVLDLLTSLGDKSLVLFDESREGQGRYRLLETVRQYGLERLRQSGECEEINKNHRDYFLILAEEAEGKLSGLEQAEWLEQLEAEHDNLRAALNGCQRDEESPEAGLRLAAALFRFWNMHGYLSEGREHLQTALSQRDSHLRTLARAKALGAAGGLSFIQGDYAASRALHKESLAIYRESGNKRGIANALNNLGMVAKEQGDYAPARALYEESLAIQRELGNKGGMAATLNNLGLLAINQGEYAAARTYLEESLAIKRELGDKGGIANALNNLGNVYWSQGGYAAARALYEESLAIKRELGDKGGIAVALDGLANVAEMLGDYPLAWALYEENLTIRRELGDKQGIAYALAGLGSVAEKQGDYAASRVLLEESLVIRRELGDKYGVAISLNGLGIVAYDRGDYAAARSFLAESLTVRRELGDKLGIKNTLEALAKLATGQGQAERACRLWAAAQALREAIGSPLSPNEKEAFDRDLAALQEAVDKKAFERIWSEGRAMALEQAIAYALEESS